MPRRIATVLAAALGAALLVPAPAHAEPTPLQRGLVAAGLTAGGELVGAGVTGAAGFGIGAASCRDSFECFAPFALGIGGAGAGAIGGGIGGAVVGGHVAKVRPGRVALGATAGAAVGLGVLVGGALAGREEIVTTGVVVGAVGMPLGAGILAATDRRGPQVRGPGGVSLAISPQLGRDYQGVRVTLVR